jgi:hypothetical protein
MKFIRLFALLLVGIILTVAIPSVGSDNTVLGSIQFEGKSKVEKTSGVWVDGQYVGYLKELKGSKKVLLLPGEHEIVVRQDGYQDFSQRLTLRPGETQLVRVAMEKGITGPMPKQTASVKIEVKPERAAVFVDGLFVGHAGEFEGAGRAMLIAPGEHHIRVILPGYSSFETDINPLANQKVSVKTELAKSSEPLPDPMLKGDPSAASTGDSQPSPPPPPAR